MLKHLFVSEVRINILKLFILQYKKSIHVRGVVRAVGAEINAVRRELDNLVELGLLKKRQSSNRLYYTANVEHPFYDEVLGLVAKEDGLCARIIKDQKKLGNIQYAAFCRGFYKGKVTSALDVDLFIVGDSINTDILGKWVKEEESRLAREINFSIVTPVDFRSLKRTNDQFIVRVLSQSRLMLVGDEEKFYSTL